MPPRYFDDLSDLDDVGSLELADYVGARKRVARRRQQGQRVPARMLIPQVPGVPMPGARLQPLGLGTTAFTVGGGTLQQLQASPQRPFMGQRLIVDVTRTNAGGSATGLVTVSRLDVGTSNQLVGSQSISANAFEPTAFDANVRFDPATPGVLITVQFNITAAPTVAGDRVDIGGTIFGTTVG